MVAPRSYSQTVPSPVTPLVDPGTGRVTEQWLQFLMSLSARTGGSPGPALDLGTVAGTSTTNTAAAADAQVLAILGDVTHPAPSLDPLTLANAANVAAIADLQALAALGDAEPPATDDAALLAYVLHD